MEALVRVLLCSCAARAVNTDSLAIVHSCLVYPVNGSTQVFVELSQDRAVNVVSEIPGADEQDVDTGDLCDFLDLILSAFLTYLRVSWHTFSRASLVSIWTIVRRESLAV